MRDVRDSALYSILILCFTIPHVLSFLKTPTDSITQRSAAGSIPNDPLFSAVDSGRYRTFPNTALLFRLRLFATGFLL
jgi:hypothetical protein